MQTKRKILSLIGAFLIHLVLGTLYITGNISGYIASYLREHESSVTIQDINILFTLQVTASTTTNFLGSWIAQQYSPYISIIIGNSLLVLGIFTSSFCKDLVSFSVTYGIMFGLGCGLSYTTPLVIGWSHFPNSKGKVSGVIVGGFGLGAAIYNQIATKIVNPHNEKANIKVKDDGTTNHYFDHSIADGVPAMLRWLAFCYLIMSVIGILLLAPIIKQNKTEKDQYSCPSVKGGLKSHKFIMLFIASICSTDQASGYYIAGSYKSFGNEKIGDDDFLSIVGSVSSVFNGSFRYIWAYLMDRTTFRLAYAILLVIQIIMMATLYYISSIEGLFFIWICVIMMCEGGHFSLFPTVMAKLFGRNMGAKVFGVFFFSFGFATIVIFLTQLYVVPSLGYQAMFWILACLSGVSFAINWKFQEVSPWKPIIEEKEFALTATEPEL